MVFFVHMLFQQLQINVMNNFANIEQAQAVNNSCNAEFERAVAFVRNLPKKGEVQLSNDTKGKFYGM